MRRGLKALAIAGVMMGSGAAQADSPPWEWRDTNRHLYEYLQDDYRVVQMIEVHNDPRASQHTAYTRQEFILQREGSLVRCQFNQEHVVGVSNPPPARLTYACR